MRVTSVAMVWMVALVMTSASSVSGRQAAGAGERASETRQREALQAVCGSCHGVDLISGFRSKEEWKTVVDSMKSNGASGSEEEFALIDLYIAEHVTSVNVNTAPAGEFVPVLEVEVDVAENIVKYRTEHGRFKSVEDLKNVPGLTAAKVDARKDRLRF
jgi:competence ComEA-like helix-hairpin-helix protein